MKNFLALVICMPFLLKAQPFSFRKQVDSLLSIGKQEFRKPFEEQHFEQSVLALELAARLEPDNPEIHYFLGYTYSRLNAKDGERIPQMRRHLLELSSHELERVIALSPQYTGQLVVLDPYSKLTAEWGSMALCYEARHQPDSVRWALEEGKKRGAFGKFFLEINRYMLNRCTKNALLLTSGDNLTFPLYYLQKAEGFRKDVMPVNVTLLNTYWYPKQLAEEGRVAFGMDQQVMDTLNYTYWQDSLVSIENKYAVSDFYWTLKASPEQVLWRGDQLLWNLLRMHRFETDVFFTATFDPSEQIGLQDHVLHHVLLQELNPNHKPQDDFKTYSEEIQNVFPLLKWVNKNSADEVSFVSVLRYSLLLWLDENHRKGNKKEAKQVLKWLQTYFPERDYPYATKELKQYVEHIQKQY